MGEFIMQTITLTPNQISQLITDKFLKLSREYALELYEDKLILNFKGEIYNITETNIQFTKQKISNEYVIKFLQNLICEHLNLEFYDVIFSERSRDEYKFNIKLSPNIYVPIIVCESRYAVMNTREITDEPIDIFTTATQIGLYKQLGSSVYYFRWLEQ